ncbi:hypothetical protein [Nocardia sp. CDC160]|uniref:hypothetical protein n=1 Tax=Nocardia sp. CDC160 TaxID=3112166 RepID=UPI002DBD570E|nr:hypothetical protein [Nocardia sp. CDC160]MEC3915083.1 hypothetical protein [Nocardia sp. CDC160]
MAVGVGAYDGGYAYEGELLIFDLRSGRATSVLRGSREVLDVEWAGGQALRVVVAPPDDFPDGRYDAEARSYAFSAVIERSDWSDVAGGSVWSEELAGERIEFDRTTTELKAKRSIELLSEVVGEPREPRLRVWDVQELPDGRVLSCAYRVLAESWLPDGKLEWRVRDEYGGRQLAVRAGQRDCWVNVERPPWRLVGSERVNEPQLVARVSLADGKVVDSLRLDSPVMFTTRDDGWLALRATDWDRSGSLALIPSTGTSPELDMPLGGFDPFNHAFPVRHSGQLLFLEGMDPEQPARDKRVVAVDPAGDGGPEVRELFPLEWDTARAGHLFGGPGIEVGGAEDRDLIHAGAVHDGAGLLPGNVFVVRRSGRSGVARWVFTADVPVTALDGDENTVYVAFNSGELVALRASDGTVRWRHELEVDGRSVVALSLTLTRPGRLLIGTVDGRILDCSEDFGY